MESYSLYWNRKKLSIVKNINFSKLICKFVATQKKILIDFKIRPAGSKLFCKISNSNSAKKKISERKHKELEAKFTR